MTARRWDECVEWYLDQIEPPETEPVTLEYLRDQHLRITNGDLEDERIMRALRAATEQCQQYTQRALVPETLALVLNRFPAYCIELPKPPLIEVLSITYIDEDGAEQTLDSSVYHVVRKVGPKCRRSVIELAQDQSWPATRLQSDAVTVNYRVGYVEEPGVSPETMNIPEDLLEGICMRAASYYAHRSDSIVGQGFTVQAAIVSSKTLWSDYRVY